MKIFIVRHGESIQQTNENINQLPDHQIHLTKKGIDQACKAGEFLKSYMEENNLDKKRTVIWTSTYDRTRETTKIINETLEIDIVKEDDRLVEQDFGIMNEMEREDFEKLFPVEYELYNKIRNHKGKYYARFPMGESPMDVSNRIKGFIDTLFRDLEYTDNIIIVTHGVTGRMFIKNWLHYTPEWFDASTNLKNASVYLLERDTDKMSKDLGYIFVPKV